MKLVGIQVGRPRLFEGGRTGDRSARDWTSGIAKEPVSGAVRVGTTNLEGDAQADLDAHGGPDKAICVYPAEHFRHWKASVDLILAPGGFGENFTTRGMLESDACIGDVYRVGSCLVQVSQPRQPCWKLARRWSMPDLAAKVQQTGKTGWYFRVIEEGMATAGDAIVLEQRHDGAWTVAAANDVMHYRKHDRDAAAELAAHVGLSESWRATLSRRAAAPA